MKLQQIFLLVVSPWVILAHRRRVSFKSCLSTNTNSEILQSKPVRSRIECSVMCLNNQDCLSASYCKTGDGFMCQLTGSYVEGNCSTLAPDNGCSRSFMMDPCEHGGTFYPHNRTCHCAEGFVGHYCQRRYRDCSEAPTSYKFIQYTIQPFGSKDALEWVCTSGNRERNRLVDIHAYHTNKYFDFNFTLSWQHMKRYCPFNEGFSFLGLENLHQLTKQGVYDLYVYLGVSMKDKGIMYYRNIRVDSEAKGYALYWDNVDWDKTYYNMSEQYLDGFGGAGDETKNLNGAGFGTYDNDVNGCARAKNAGWWFNPLGCTKLIFHAKGMSWPTNRNGTLAMEELQYVGMNLKKVYWYVEDDLVL